ncbi:MAG TPA: CBS domain-containing protein [Acidiferrobacteraceae bacterium]|nr:CBS domain-containing protein [Acidiferrobacteraceae bacterium]
MRVRDIMSTNVKTVQPGSRVREVALAMCLHRISGMPVIDEQRHIVGIVSEKDILLAVYPKVDDFMQSPAPPSLEDMESEYRDVLHLQVADVMKRKVFTVGPDEPILRAASAMFVHRIRRIPVANPEHELLGILSLGDVHKAVFREMFEREFAHVAQLQDQRSSRRA